MFIFVFVFCTMHQRYNKRLTLKRTAPVAGCPAAIKPNALHLLHKPDYESFLFFKRPKKKHVFTVIVCPAAVI